MMYLRIFVLLLVLGGLSLGALGDITVEPLALRLPIPPGGVGSGSFVVRNLGTDTAHVRITLHDWWRTPEGKFQVLPPGSLPGSCAPWLTYSANSLEIPPGGEVRITVRLQVPKDVSGDHWALLLVAEYRRGGEAAPSGQGTVGTTRVVMAYAVKVLQEDPKAIPKAEIRGIKLLGTSPLRISIRYANTGTKHTTNSGVVEIRDIYGETVRRFTVPSFPLLPGEERLLILEDPTGKPLPPGLYYVIAVFDFGGDYLIQGGAPIRIPSK